MTIMLTGTLPLRPYDPDGFVGTLESDGQQVKVAALACDQGSLVTLSLVGFDTSVGAVLAALWRSTAVRFIPDPAWQETWDEAAGPALIKRSGGTYKQCIAKLEGTREVHALALIHAAHLTEGMLHPPELPAPPKAQDREQGEQLADDYDEVEDDAPPPVSPAWVPRFLLGNGDEDGPARSSFQGHLAALRIPMLYRHAARPDWPAQWAEALWKHGLAHELITPLATALGLRAWRFSGDLLAWGRLVGAGVCEGWLPWREREPAPSPVSR